MKRLLVILAWVLLLGFLMAIMAPITIHFLGPYLHSSIPLDILVQTWVMLLAIMIPFGFGISFIIMGLFTATIEAFDGV